MIPSESMTGGTYPMDPRFVALVITFIAISLGIAAWLLNRRGR